MITGRLGKDAEVRQAQTGTYYFSCNVANSEYNDKETHWYRVISYNNIHVKNYDKFKKGSAVIIIGRYNESLYQNKDGKVEINRDIIASSIDYNETVRLDNNNHQQVSAPATVKIEQPQQMVNNSGPAMKPFDPTKLHAYQQNPQQIQQPMQQQFSQPVQPVNQPMQQQPMQQQPVQTVANVEDDDLPF